MKSFICLALSCLLIGLLYVYMRQQFAAQAVQINQLREVVRSIATEIESSEPAKPPPPPPVQVNKIDQRITVSDDSESEGDDSDSDEETGGNDSESDDEKPLDDVEIDEVLPPLEDVEISVAEPFVLDISEQTKSIVLEDLTAKKVNYEKMTVKELKELATGAPASLKSKKDLIAYLEKK